MTLLLLAVGLAALYYGAEWLVLGASRIAASLRVKPLVIGLTVVAFGTSMPEMVAGTMAAWAGKTDVALGNVFGSNIANIGLILGLAAAIRAIPSDRAIFRREIPIMVLTTVLVYALAATGTIGRFWGVVLLVGLLGFAWMTLRWARIESRSDADFADIAGMSIDLDADIVLWREASRAGVGIGGLVVGGKLIVDAATDLAVQLGVPDFAIAVILVALGTSLPELATSVVAALRGEADVIIGNVVGSNIFNLLGALGASAVVRPLPVDAAIIAFDLPVVLALTALASFLLYTYGRLQRWEGWLLLGGYAVYVGIVVRELGG